MDPSQLAVESNSGLVYRWRPSTSSDSLNFLMFHGLSGNEQVMWLLVSALPEGSFIASPRAPFSLPEDDGYSWVDPTSGDGFKQGGFGPGLEAANNWVRGMLVGHQLTLDQTIFVGFSQGSALAFLLAEEQSTCPAGIVSLAAYLPEGDFHSLDGLPVFWGHGSQDQTVPVERARRDVSQLQQLGAQVQYCEAEVGHKVGVECMRGLKDWLRRLNK